MALYLGKDKIAGFSTDSRIGDTLPVGAIIDYDGTEVPANWELVEGAENTGVVIIKLFDTDEEEYDKMFSSVEAYYEEVNEWNAHLITNVIYEDNDYGDYEYYQAAGSYGEFDNENNLVAVTLYYTRIDGNGNRLTGFSRRAYLNEGVKTIEEGDSWSFYLRNPIDSLDSTYTDQSLSANQGRILNNKIAVLESQLASLYKLELRIYDFNFSGNDVYQYTNNYSIQPGWTWQDLIDDTDFINFNYDFKNYEITTGQNVVYFQMYPVNDLDGITVKPTDRIVPGRIYKCTQGGGSN